MLKRDFYLNQLRPYLGNDLIKVLVGMRRSGKSTLLAQIQQELLDRGIHGYNFIYFNFEQPGNSNLCSADALYDEIRSRTQGVMNRVSKFYLFLDELQEVADWDRFLHSCRAAINCDIYIASSSSTFLSAAENAHLLGRCVVIRVYPFSFSEFLKARRMTGPSASTDTAFLDYVRDGGLPFLDRLGGDADACTQYLQDAFYAIVMKYVVGKNRIRDAELLNEIMLYVLSNVGDACSASGLTKFFRYLNRKVSHDTAANYLQACVDAYLFCRVPREELPAEKIISSGEKYYITDHGLRSAIYGQEYCDIEQTLKNIVCVELLRRGYTVTSGRVGTREIDFVAKKHSTRVYVQVCYLLSSPDIIRRKFDVLQDIPDNFPKYVVSMDDTDLGRGGIKHKHIRDFLLMNVWY
ncbi:MAG: ATP-binding protein [Clostridiales bacterium]|nr:ATP-binding protein [Clostridiales bacterium]